MFNFNIFNKGENNPDLCFINALVTKGNTKVVAENKDKKDMRTRYFIRGFAAQDDRTVIAGMYTHLFFN